MHKPKIAWKPCSFKFVQDSFLAIKNNFRTEYSQRLCIVFDDTKRSSFIISNEIEHMITHTIYIKHLPKMV